MAKTYLEWFQHLDEDAFDKTWLSTAGVDLERDSIQSQYIQVRSLQVISIMLAEHYSGPIIPSDGFDAHLEHRFPRVGVAPLLTPILRISG